MRRKKKPQMRDEEDERDDPAEQLGQPAVGDLAGVLHAVRFELLGQLRIVDARRRELLRCLRIVRRRLLQRAADRLIADGDFGDLRRSSRSVLNSL